MIINEFENIFCYIVLNDLTTDLKDVTGNRTSTQNLVSGACYFSMIIPYTESIYASHCNPDIPKGKNQNNCSSLA